MRPRCPRARRSGAVADVVSGDPRCVVRDQARPGHVECLVLRDWLLDLGSRWRARGAARRRPHARPAGVGGAGLEFVGAAVAEPAQHHCGARRVVREIELQAALAQCLEAGGVDPEIGVGRQIEGATLEPEREAREDHSEDLRARGGEIGRGGLRPVPARHDPCVGADRAADANPEPVDGTAELVDPGLGVGARPDALAGHRHASRRSSEVPEVDGIVGVARLVCRERARIARHHRTAGRVVGEVELQAPLGQCLRVGGVEPEVGVGGKIDDPAVLPDRVVRLGRRREDLRACGGEIGRGGLRGVPARCDGPAAGDGGGSANPELVDGLGDLVEPGFGVGARADALAGQRHTAR